MEGTRAKECLEQRAQSGWNCVRAGRAALGAVGQQHRGGCCALVSLSLASQDPQSESPRVGPCQGRSQRAPLWFVGCWTLNPPWSPGRSPAGWHILWNAESCARPSSPSCPSALIPTPLSCESTCQEPWARPIPGARLCCHCTTQLCSWEKPRWSGEIAPKEALPAVP